MTPPTGLLQVALRAEDLDAAEAFYGDLLGAEAAGRFDPPGLLFFRLGDVRLLLEQGAPNGLIYLQVPDLEATVERLRAAGVKVESEPHVIFTHEDDSLGPAGHDERHAFIRDPSGNLVALVALVPRGS
ncbi:MAG TPA: VOC family protein [Trueperaceae bacterium]